MWVLANSYNPFAKWHYLQNWPESYKGWVIVVHRNASKRYKRLLHWFCLWMTITHLCQWWTQIESTHTHIYLYIFLMNFIESACNDTEFFQNKQLSLGSESEINFVKRFFILWPTELYVLSYVSIVIFVTYYYQHRRHYHHTSVTRSTVFCTNLL